MSPKPVILDVDPGHDDAVAIMLACGAPELDLLAVTTVAGNVPLEKTTRNVLRVLSLTGHTGVPVAAGASSPLRRPLHTAENIHGESGLDGPEIPDPSFEHDERGATELIADTVRGASEPVTLIPTGPLTNVATFLREHPELKDRVARISLMGGSMGHGNTTPAAEFNIYVDPEAAAEVLASGIPITVVPLEVTHRALATEEVIGRIAALNTPVARMSVALMRFFAETYERVFGFTAPAVHDPCAVASVIDPGIVATRFVNVAVDTASELRRGRTACDLHGVSGRAPNADVGVDLDATRFWDLMVGALATYRS